MYAESLHNKREEMGNQTPGEVGRNPRVQTSSHTGQEEILH